MWTTWTFKNPSRRFISCTNYNDEGRNYGIVRRIDLQLPDKWHREKMYELRAQVNGEHVILYAPPPLDAPIMFHVNEAPLQVVIQDTDEHGNGHRVEDCQVAIIKFILACLVYFFVEMLYA
ncbi:unnamed protein product [Lactuca virosa]|uniref:Uncharacterized protein n=1 Tax=Lactuca virosa TaxID=75947 RepID=A0AAU9LFL0_9ASTR|nr:unnamed protein product [Lactuca virosa]